MIGDNRRAARALPQEEGLILRAQKLRGESVGLRLLPGARIVSGQPARAARGVDRTVDRVRLRTELFEPPVQFEMAQLVQNHLEPARRVVVVLSVVIEATFGRFEQSMAVLQKVRICGDEFDLVLIFQVVYDSFEQTFFSAADLIAAVSRPLSGSFQRSHFCSYFIWTSSHRSTPQGTERLLIPLLLSVLSVLSVATSLIHSGDSSERLSQYCCSASLMSERRTIFSKSTSSSGKGASRKAAAC